MGEKWNQRQWDKDCAQEEALLKEINGWVGFRCFESEILVGHPVKDVWQAVGHLGTGRSLHIQIYPWLSLASNTWIFESE